AEYRITYWQDIPCQVDAFCGAERVRVQLGGRFQALIDAAAMRDGVVGTDAYLEGWRTGPVISRTGTPREVAEAVAADLEAQFDRIRTASLS
ncbi:MAG TPA: virulence factor, partial [bacterium]|nr:virulence factor [bacterium]